MPEILLVNPRRRSGGRKRRSAAQRRATAKMLAANRARRGGSVKRRKSARRSNPAPLSVMHNPRRRRVSARRRRNPISLRRMVSGGASLAPMKLISSALIGAAGATAVNTIMARVPVPASLMVGRMRYVTQALAAIAIGTIASKVKIVGAGTAAKMAEGSLTVTLHDAIRDVAGGMGINLAGMGYYLPGRGVTAVPSASGGPARLAGMNEYLTGPGANVTTMRPRMAGMGAPARGFNF
jgi:hypothetical protein